MVRCIGGISGQSADRYVLFAHATGVPSAVYDSFLATIARDANIPVFSFDMRGFGESKIAYSLETNTKLWETFCEDFSLAQAEIIRKGWVSRNSSPVLMGHSLGASVALQTARFLDTKHVIALDPVILPTKMALFWGFFALLGLRQFHPISKIVKRRKVPAEDLDTTCQEYQKKAFFKGWRPEEVRAHLEATINWEGAPKEKQDKKFEALCFEMQPFSAIYELLRLPRHTIAYDFIFGETSDVSNPRVAWLLKRIFSHCRTDVIPHAGHMFPFQRPEYAAKCVVDFLNRAG